MTTWLKFFLPYSQNLFLRFIKFFLVFRVLHDFPKKQQKNHETDNIFFWQTDIDWMTHFSRSILTSLLFLNLLRGKECRQNSITFVSDLNIYLNFWCVDWHQSGRWRWRWRRWWSCEDWRHDCHRRWLLWCWLCRCS